VRLVHSSLSSMGIVPGGAETVIQGLLTALGEDGTLLFPALSYEHATPRNPYFDIKRTPSNVGAIPEYFRTRPGTRRSMHPTHSVSAVGRLAGEITRDHLLDSTPCGEHSPFHLLPEYQGQILMLGCGLKPNTSFHAIEEMVTPPYLFNPPLRYRLVFEDDHMIEKTYLPHNFDGWRQRYDRAEAILSELDLRTGSVLQAQAHLIAAPALWKTALAKLKRDPLYFVEKIG